MQTKLKTKPLIPMGMLSAGLLLLSYTVGCTPVKAQNADRETPKVKLQEKIKQAGGYAENKYSINSWAALRNVMNAARQIADKAEATPEELEAASANVQQKIDALEKRQVLPDLAPRIGLSASLFATNRKGPVNNVALMWATSDPQDSYEIYRARGRSKDFTKIYTGRGLAFNDYSLSNGNYSYHLVAYREGKKVVSNVQQVATMPMPAGVKDYSNQTGVGEPIGEPLKVGNTFYRFPSERDGKALKAMWVETSRDGKNWNRGAVVMDRNSHPDLEDYKFEAVTFFFDKKRDRIVLWAHWERAAGYGSGRAIVATAKPGERFTVHHIYNPLGIVATAKPGERFTVHHIYNPLGIEVRDMSVFRDDDGQGYLVAASNVPGQGANATLYIFKMNDDYTDVTGITNKVMEGGYREAPHIIKTKGTYYLFFSQAAGWYPSQAGYVASQSLDGRWSDVRNIANSSTFAAQSGGIINFGRDKTFVPVFMPNRWIRGEGTSGNVALPLHLDNGFAFADYAPTLLLEPAKRLVIPLHAGKLLSQDKPASSSIAGSPGNEASKAFDGDYATAFRSDEKKWPFSVTTDLGAICQVQNVQISWHIHKGSEAYYKYTLEGSLDGQEWQVILDRTDDKDTVVSKTYGFSSNLLPDSPSTRYVRVNVQRAVLHNNPNNWYPPTLYEVKVYGEKGE